MKVSPIASLDRAAPHDAVDQIVDVDPVIERPAVADHREAAALDAAKQLEKAQVAGAVDAGRPEDRDGQAALGHVARGDPLAFELGFLIRIARRERRILGRRRLLDVAVHADRAAMHEAADACLDRRIEQVLHRRSVDLPEQPGLDPLLPVQRSDMINQIDAAHRLAQRRRIAKVALDDLDAKLRQRRGPGRVPDQRPNRGIVRRQPADERPAGEAGGTGDQDLACAHSDASFAPYRSHPLRGLRPARRLTAVKPTRRESRPIRRSRSFCPLRSFRRPIDRRYGASR